MKHSLISFILDHVIVRNSSHYSDALMLARPQLFETLRVKLLNAKLPPLMKDSCIPSFLVDTSY